MQNYKKIWTIMKNSFHKQIQISPGMSNKITIIKVPLVIINMKDYKLCTKTALQYTLMKRKIDIKTFKRRLTLVEIKNK